MMRLRLPAASDALFILIFSLLWLPLLLMPSGAAAQSCSERPEFQLLDFWIGDWEVFTAGSGEAIGFNYIEKVVDGCAIIEHWEDTRGRQGKSLFYYHPAEERWKQVWVTPDPFRAGGVKEKAHVETLSDGGVRFQGTVTTPAGRTYLDRTTLTPLLDGAVRQVIAVSSDNGRTWRELFNAIYLPLDSEQ